MMDFLQRRFASCARKSLKGSRQNVHGPVVMTSTEEPLPLLLFNAAAMQALSAPSSLHCLKVHRAFV